MTKVYINKFIKSTDFVQILQILYNFVQNSNETISKLVENCRNISFPKIYKFPFSSNIREKKIIDIITHFR